MQSKLVRVVAEETSDVWGDWAAETVHSGISKGSVLRFFPRLAPTKHQIKSAGATIASAAAGIGNLFRKSGSDQISTLTISEASSMVDVEGHGLTLGSIYAAHPLVSGVMLKADTLHTHIIKEQRAQIIRYFRSTVALKSLTIEVVCHNSGKFYAGGGWKIATAHAGRDSAEEQRHWFTASYNKPQRETLTPNDNLFWMPYFDEVVAATKGAAGGTIESITTLNTSFGISAEAASIANIDSNWISNQSFVIRAEYA